MKNVYLYDLIISAFAIKFIKKWELYFKMLLICSELKTRSSEKQIYGIHAN